MAESVNSSALSSLPKGLFPEGRPTRLGHGRTALRIIFYGSLGERLGREIDLEVPEGTHTVAQLRELLALRFPGASEDLARTRACVGESLVGEDYDFASDDTVEFFPPLSGG